MPWLDGLMLRFGDVDLVDVRVADLISFFPSVCFVDLPFRLSVYLGYVQLPSDPAAQLFIYWASVCLSFYMSICLSIYLSTYLSVYMYVYVYVYVCMYVYI